LALLGRAAFLVLVLIAVLYFGWPRRPSPLTLAYDVSLLEAEESRLAVTLTMEGDLPRPLLFVLPGQIDAISDEIPTAWLPGITIRDAHHLNPDGTARRLLSVSHEDYGWLLHHKGQSPTRLVYAVDLKQASALDEDIRRHLTVPYRNGFRAAGYHIFLVPDGVDSCRVTVRFQANTEGVLAVPWPQQNRATTWSLSHRNHRTSTGTAAEALAGVATDQPLAQGTGTLDTRSSRPYTVGTYDPTDLRDLFAALIAWGDIRLMNREIDGCHLRVGLGDSWLFEDNDLVYLLTRIAKAEIDFFGSPPQPAILCLVAPNPVFAREGFDYYGVHVGHSILLFLDPEITYADLAERAANVVAHEMFHGWLGEAIRHEDPTMLWFVEGATTWYAARILKETGIWTPWRAESVVGERIDHNYYGNELLGAISLADAAAGIMSDAVTTRFAYAGGTLAAAALDRWLATGSGAVRPLDEVLRYLYTQRRGTVLTRTELEQAVATVTGVDCSTWLDTYVYGKETLPRQETLF
jgi:hypothetical protein